MVKGLCLVMIFGGSHLKGLSVYPFQRLILSIL